MRMLRNAFLTKTFELVAYRGWYLSWAGGVHFDDIPNLTIQRDGWFSKAKRFWVAPEFPLVP